MKSEIGSNFWLNPNIELPSCKLEMPLQFNISGSDYSWLSTGRSAIKFVLQTIDEKLIIKKKSALLPSFTCFSVIEPFINQGYSVLFYPVKKDLSANASEIVSLALQNEVSVVLWHRYFGFDTINEDEVNLGDTLRQNGIFSIEDCTQNLYSDIRRSDSDFTIGSIRKWMGVPDGAFAVKRIGKFNEKLSVWDFALEKKKIEASYAKYKFLFEEIGNKSDFRKKFEEAEEILESQKVIYKISPISESVQSTADISLLKEKRKRNFSILYEGLKGDIYPVFTIEKSNDITPLYFPLRAENRSELQLHLRNHNIFAPIVWPKDERQSTVLGEAEVLYNDILCIPVDQRYDIEDMERIISVVKDFNK